MADVLLEAHELHTYYGASHVLHGIDFAVREGEAVESGSATSDFVH